MASDCYGMYYRAKSYNHTAPEYEHQPWTHPTDFQVEAGDDLVLWGDDHLAQTVLRMTSRTKQGEVGLG